MKKTISILVAAIAVVAFSGCGTLFWAERKGQPTSKQIDPTVLILDCCGLFFGIIPGAVALVLDLNNNTIYYTKAEVKNLSEVEAMDRSQMAEVKIPAGASVAEINEILSRELGQEIDLSQAQLAAAN